MYKEVVGKATLATTTAPNEPLRRRFEVAREVIREAGTLANSYFSRIVTLTIKRKGSHDLVSDADVNTEKLIRESLATYFRKTRFWRREWYDGHQSRVQYLGC